MFKEIFSFSGRIRRLEYGLSLLLYIVLYFILIVSWNALYHRAFFFYLATSALVWFYLAQGAKRCHDMGYSAFYQLIPFYFLIMIFQEGDSGSNGYGLNPKDRQWPGYRRPISTLSKLLSIKKSRVKLIGLMSSSVLAYVLCSAVLLEYLSTNELLEYSLTWVLAIPFFFLALLSVYKGKPIRLDSYLVLKQRFLFSAFYFLTLRLYLILFSDTEFKLFSIPLEFLFILIQVGLTWCSYRAYITVFNKTRNQI